MFIYASRKALLGCKTDPGDEMYICASPPLLPDLSPLGWEHINLTDDCLWRDNAKFRAGKFRPLRPLASPSVEDILEVYERAYDPQFPVLCFDERPYQLLQGLARELPMKPGSVAKVDSQYSRGGTCCVLAAVEPRAGRRQVQVHRHRGKREYASFMRGLAAKYPEAQRIILIQDNLNTHGPGCFYEFYPADEARKLAKRFEIHFTPKKASWLNMAEIELSVMSKQCFARRIATMRDLRTQVRAWEKRRNREGAKIGWRFTTDKARKKLQRHYKAVLN